MEIEIKDVAVHYFDELFTSTSPTEFEVALVEVPHHITNEINNELMAPVTEEGTGSRWNDCVIFSTVLAVD